MKLDTHGFGSHLKELGFNFYSGVPCSFLKYLINYAINECEYVMASNEGDAVAIASGANIGGNKSVVLMQNSGLTNAVSPLTSLNHTFKLPVLGFVSLRGESGLSDEPQHELMGTITAELLTLMQVKWDYLSTDLQEAKKQLKLANTHVENNSSYFFIVRKNTFKPVELNKMPHPKPGKRQFYKEGNRHTFPKRIEVLEALSKTTGPNTILLATTGKTGRELFEVEDKPSNLYMVGSMGCISSLGLGLALSQPRKKIIIIDGDGSLLMRLGAMPTIAYYQPDNLLHVLLDNNSHDSTGGQATVSDQVEFVDLAASIGYAQADHTTSLKRFQSRVKNWEHSPTLTFLYIKVAKGSKENLGRPTKKPHQVKDRLKIFING